MVEQSRASAIVARLEAESMLPLGGQTNQSLFRAVQRRGDALLRNGSRFFRFTHDV